ncbi:MAG: hypothetical protein H6607_06055 [Flavobacteriales bacterium]|nr:hypothetical protein [Flavobacteriales bacterium]
MEHYGHLQKALDRAKWLNFEHQQKTTTFGVVDGPEDDFVVCSKDESIDMEIPFAHRLPRHYAHLSYRKIEKIRTDENPLKHWEEIVGRLSTLDGNILRFILHEKVPLKKFIRYELAIRGYDEHGKWIGFEQAKRLWLNK